MADGGSLESQYLPGSDTRQGVGFENPPKPDRVSVGSRCDASGNIGQRQPFPGQGLIRIDNRRGVARAYIQVIELMLDEFVRNLFAVEQRGHFFQWTAQAHLLEQAPLCSGVGLLAQARMPATGIGP